MQFLLLDVTYILHNKNPLLNKLSPTQSSMGIPFRMVMLHEMIICELCLGEKQGAGKRFFCFLFFFSPQGMETLHSGSIIANEVSEGGDRSGLQDETGHRPLPQGFSRALGGISEVIPLTFATAPAGVEPGLLVQLCWQK